MQFPRTTEDVAPFLEARLKSAEPLIAELYEVFPAKRYESIGSLVGVYVDIGGEVSDLEREFADKTDWTQIDPEWLDAAPNGWASARSFFSDAARLFYLPAYILADIHGQLEHSNGAAFDLTHGFVPAVKPKDVERLGEELSVNWSDLTEAQVRAVVRFLEWAAVWNEFDGEDIRPALEAYWYPRLSGELPQVSQ